MLGSMGPSSPSSPAALSPKPLSLVRSSVLFPRLTKEACIGSSPSSACTRLPRSESLDVGRQKGLSDATKSSTALLLLTKLSPGDLSSQPEMAKQEDSVPRTISVMASSRI